MRVSCASDSALVDVALRNLAAETLADVLAEKGDHEFAFQMAVMRVVFGTDDRVSLHLQEWDAEGDGPDGDDGEPMPVSEPAPVVAIRRVA